MQKNIAHFPLPVIVVEMASPLSLMDVTLVRFPVTRLEGVKGILNMLSPLLERTRAQQLVEDALRHWMSPSGTRETGLTSII